jgi:hypothetical protein
MFTRHLIDKVLITLEVGEKTTLFILIQKDGTVHRKGSGSITEEKPLMVGHSADGHYEALMLTVNEEVFEHTGVLKMPDRLGNECQLTIIFQGKQDVDFGFRVVYGDQSQGPPVELAQILINAVKLTEPWYQEQLSAALEPEKKWWEVWK